MIPTAVYPFFETIHQLRANETIVLYSQVPTITPDDEMKAQDYLQQEYNRESYEYPYNAPLFDSKAALWAAKTVYIASQLLLYRKDAAEDIAELLPPFTGPINSARMLSADLMLRFASIILKEAIFLDENDALIPVLVKHLQCWNYSGMKYIGPELSFDKVYNDTIYFESNKNDNIYGQNTEASFALQLLFADPCFKQLYIDRIIELQHKKLSGISLIEKEIRISLGNHYATFWNPQI